MGSRASFSSTSGAMSCGELRVEPDSHGERLDPPAASAALCAAAPQLLGSSGVKVSAGT